MGTVLGACAVAAILFLGVLFWTSAPNAVFGLANAGSRAAASVKEVSSTRTPVVAETVEDAEGAATEAGTATARALREASENVQEAASQTTRDLADTTRERLDELTEGAAEQVEAAVGGAAISARETTEGAVASAVERVAGTPPDAVLDAASEKLQQAAEKLQEAAEKLDRLAARIELTSPSPDGQGAASPEDGSAESRPEPAAPRASAEAQRPAPTSDGRPATAQTAAPAVAAPILSTSGARAPRVLLPRPEPASRVAPGPLVVEARGRGDAPIAQIRLVLNGATLPVTLEHRGEATWRAHAPISVAPGSHVVDAVVVDTEGRTGSYRWRFTAAP